MSGPLRNDASKQVHRASVFSKWSGNLKAVRRDLYERECQKVNGGRTDRRAWNARLRSAVRKIGPQTTGATGTSHASTQHEWLSTYEQAAGDHPKSAGINGPAMDGKYAGSQGR